MSSPLNADGGRTVPWWVQAMFVPAISMVIGGAIVWGRTENKMEVFAEAIQQLDKRTTEKFDTASSLNSERLTALSLRMNSQEGAIRDAAIAAARQQEQLSALRASLEESGKQRDAKLDAAIERLQAMEQGQNSDRIRSARMESILERVLDLVEPQPPKRNGPPR